jgi:Flp pilus assembly protein TadD
MEKGQSEEAIREYHLALRLKPDHAPAHTNLGALLMKQGERQEAIEHFRAAARITPDNAHRQNNLGLALLLNGQWREASGCFRRATELQPRQAEFHCNHAYTLQHLGDTQAARAERSLALRLDPNWPQRVLGLAWKLATHPQARRRDGAHAVVLAEQVWQASGEHDPQVLDTLAAAYAEARRFPEAIAACEKALLRAPQHSALTRQLEHRLGLYKRGQPFRSGAALAAHSSLQP